MEDEWWPIHEFDASELSYGIPTDPRNISSLTRKILNSPYIDNSQGFNLEILLDLSQLDEDILESDTKVSSLTEKLRGRIEPLLRETNRLFGFESDLSGWNEGYGSIIDYTEDKKGLVDCIRYLVAEKDLFEYCTLGVSFCLIPVSTLLEDPEFTAVCEEIEKRTGGEFSIRENAELGPYDGIEAGSSFYQIFLLVSPLYEFPLQFFRGHSEDNRLASPYYNYIFSKICTLIDCKLTLLRA
jgi:hypothetical protein